MSEDFYDTLSEMFVNEQFDELTSLFFWGETRQGYDFWRDCYNKSNSWEDFFNSNGGQLLYYVFMTNTQQSPDDDIDFTELL